MLYLLTYEFVGDYLERRTALRPAHLDLCRQAVARGEMLAGGAVGDPPDSGLLLFQGAAGHAEHFARHDPYVTQGLVTRWHVKPWKVVLGIPALAADPL